MRTYGNKVLFFIFSTLTFPFKIKSAWEEINTFCLHCTMGVISSSISPIIIRFQMAALTCEFSIRLTPKSSLASIFTRWRPTVSTIGAKGPNSNPKLFTDLQLKIGARYLVLENYLTFHLRNEKQLWEDNLELMQHYVAVKKTGTCFAKYFMNNYQDVQVKGEVERMIKNHCFFWAISPASWKKKRKKQVLVKIHRSKNFTHFCFYKRETKKH